MTVSLGATGVLYAFRGPLSFSTVFGQFKGAETNLLGVIIIYKDFRPCEARKVRANSRYAISAPERLTKPGHSLK